MYIYIYIHICIFLFYIFKISFTKYFNYIYGLVTHGRRARPGCADLRRKHVLITAYFNNV